jgi:hypothetical protein
MDSSGRRFRRLQTSAGSIDGSKQRPAARDQFIEIARGDVRWPLFVPLPFEEDSIPGSRVSTSSQAVPGRRSM